VWTRQFIGDRKGRSSHLQYFEDASVQIDQTHISWYNRDETSLLSPSSLENQLFKAGELDLEPLFKAFPVTMVSAMALKPRSNLLQPDTEQTISYSRFFKALSNLPHLTTLYISADCWIGIWHFVCLNISNVVQ
jgi:hypothetical protein